MVEWESILRGAASSVQEVTDRLRNRKEGLEEVGKGAGGDMTMRIDMEAEKRIIDIVSQVPDARVVAEEAGLVGARKARWTVVVDPIDGSWNFSRGVPFYCTSIAVIEGDGLKNVKFGLVRNLVSGETYFAQKARGAERDGESIHASKRRELRETCLSIDMSRAKVGVIESLVPLIASIYKQTHFGANALELCLLADGRIDGLIDIRGMMRVMDLAAGYLIAEEAGAVFCDEKGKELDPEISIAARFNVIALSNAALQKKVLQELARRPT